MPKNFIRILIIAAAVVILLALAYAIYYFITADPRVSENIFKAPSVLPV
jgi:flagellar basal body-associated protein FliL